MKKITYLELDGKISLVTQQGKKEINREELDGKTCLKAILHVIEKSFYLLDTDEEFRKELKKVAKERFRK